MVYIKKLLELQSPTNIIDDNIALFLIKVIVIC